MCPSSSREKSNESNSSVESAASRCHQKNPTCVQRQPKGGRSHPGAARSCFEQAAIDYACTTTDVVLCCLTKNVLQPPRHDPQHQKNSPHETEEPTGGAIGMQEDFARKFVTRGAVNEAHSHHQRQEIPGLTYQQRSENRRHKITCF